MRGRSSTSTTSSGASRHLPLSRGRWEAGAAHCFIGCGRPKAFPLLPLWEAANQKPSLGGRWRLSRKAKTTDEGKVITITNPVLYNSPPPHQSSAPCGLQLLHQREKPALRGALLARALPKAFPLRWGARRKKKPNGLAFSAERRCGCAAAAGFSTEGRNDG